MSIKVNPPPQIRIPEAFFKDPEVRPFFEQQNTILFQLWIRVGGSTDFICAFHQVSVVEVSVDTVLTSAQLGSLIVVDTASGDINLTLPAIANDDIGKSIIVVIVDATNDCYVYQGGGYTVLGEDNVLMDDQYLSIHFTSIYLTDWIAQ